MARTGKIARLPEPIRSELNRRLRDGQLGTTILPWVNGLPEVRAILEAEFGNKDINAQNLSDWRTGGFADWERGLDRIHRTSLLAERAVALAREAGGNLNEGAAAIVSGRILEALEGMGEDAKLEDLIALEKTISNLRSGDQDKLKLEQKREELALAREKFQRDTCELFIRWATDQRATELATSNTSHADKIAALGQLMFGDDWKPADAARP